MRLRLVLAVLAGLGLAAAFPPLDLPWLAVPAVAALTVALRGVRARAGALLGGVAGLALFGVLVHWLAVVSVTGWLVLAAYCAAWLAAQGAATAVLHRLPAWPAWAACAWVLQEALRDRVPLGGFPWGRLAFSQTGTWFTSFAAVAGAPAVTFATALSGTLLAWAALRARAAWRSAAARRAARDAGAVPGGAPARAALAAAGALAAAAALPALGAAVPRPVDGQAGAGPATATVALVQGDVPSAGVVWSDERRQVLDNHVQATLRLAGQVRAGAAARPDVVLWPENSVDLDPATHADVWAALGAAAAAVDAPLLVGVVVPAPGDPSRVANAGLVWRPGTGPGARYVKRHPVPFGEWVPLRGLLSGAFAEFALVPRDFAAGDVPGVLDVGAVRLGDLMCFEVAYDDLGRDVVAAGGRMLVVQTNNATYNGTGQPEQQLAMSRLRAVEHGRAVAVVATSGITAVVAPDGTVGQSLGERAAGALVATVPLRDSLTWADRAGEWPERAAAAAALAALAAAAVRARRRDDVGCPPLPADPSALVPAKGP